jgi:hypothetical protein
MTDLLVTGQLNSTTTGQSPFVVSSTTKVDNLHAETSAGIPELVAEDFDWPGTYLSDGQTLTGDDKTSQGASSGVNSITLPVPSIGMLFFISRRGGSDLTVKYSDGNTFESVPFASQLFIIGKGTTSHDWAIIFKSY